MTIYLNHVVCFTKDNEASAKHFAEIMGLKIDGYEGFDNKFVRVDVTPSSSIFFQTIKETYPLQHLAFEMSEETFAELEQRMMKNHISYGNSPSNTTNQKTDHPFTEKGLFWIHDGCLFEVMVPNESK
ncbi:hypothetical protein [Alkalicoccobacillus gibsonii]|uniref:hypothetical protein n=1 Tax=Alkalicoccobacillus gibsonii TaxID=79881 RepID=UPI00351715E9